MRYLGTSLSLTIGAWRLRLQIAVEDADDDAQPPPARAPQGSSHRHVIVDRAGAGRSRW